MAATSKRVYKGKRTRDAYITIPLTRGKSALISLADIDLAETNWAATPSHALNKDLWYAQRQDYVTQKSVRMHRVILERILGRSLTQSESVDHINHDGLDNRRSNLRIANQSANCANSRKQPSFKGKQTHSKYKGVSRRLDTGHWIATIKVDRKQLHLGYFDSEIEAAKAYDKAARQHFGDYAKTNFPIEKGEAMMESIRMAASIRDMRAVSASGGLAYGDDSRALCNQIRSTLKAAGIPIKSVRSKYADHGQRLIEVTVNVDWQAVEASGLDWHTEYVKRAETIMNDTMPDGAGWQVVW